MVNQHKIITMTQLALYDKHEGPADRTANDYFRHDYIYRNNLGTRLAVGFGGIIILVIYWLQAFLMDGDLDLFELNIQQHVVDSIFFILALLAVYSLLGTIQGTRQYYLVQKRLAQYQALVRQLERLEERARRVYDEDDETAGDIVNTAPVRNNTGPLVRTAPPIEHTRPARRPSSPEHTHTGPLRRMPPPAERTRPPSTQPVSPGRTRPALTQPPPGHTRPRPAQPPLPTGPPRPISPHPPLPPGAARPRPQPAAPSEIEHTRVVPRPRDTDTE